MDACPVGDRNSIFSSSFAIIIIGIVVVIIIGIIVVIIIIIHVVFAPKAPSNPNLFAIRLYAAVFFGWCSNALAKDVTFIWSLR